MLKNVFIVLFMLPLFFSASGQNYTDSIQAVKGFSGTQYTQSGKVLKIQDLEFILNQNKTATIYLKKTKTLNVLSNIVSGCGGGLIGYQIGHGISTGYFNKTIIAVGCGLIIISIPISIAHKNNLKIAVDAYNATLKSTGSINKLDMRLGFTQNGIGLTLTL